MSVLLDQQQILQSVYDEATEALKVKGQATVVAGNLEVAIDESEDSVQIYGNDGSANRAIKTDASGQIYIANPGGGASDQGAPAPTADAWPIKVTDGTDIADVTAANALKVDGSAVTQPISGSVVVSNFPATQPISAASLPLPTDAATETTLSSIDGNISLLALESGGNLATIKTNTDNLSLSQGSTTSGQKGSLTLAAVNSSAPSYVDGQTSPLSLTTGGSLRSNVTSLPNFNATLNLTALNQTIAVGVISGMSTVIFDVSGTWTATLAIQATVNGSTWNNAPNYNTVNGSGFTITSNGQIYVPCGGYSQVRLLVSAFTSGTITVTEQATAGTNVVNAAQIGSWAVNGPTLTKGTQGSTGYSTQDLKDSGRVHVNYYAVAAAAGTTGTQTAITLTQSSGVSATSNANSFVITSGKRFRITSFSVATRGHNTATAQTTTFNLRINTAGAVTTSSTPIVFSARSATPATANAWDRYVIPIPDGFEILGDGTLQFGITAAATYTTNAPTWDVNITGFEY